MPCTTHSEATSAHTTRTTSSSDRSENQFVTVCVAIAVSELQGEVTVDDRRHARQDFENGLEHAPQAIRRVFAEVDRACQAERQCKQCRAARDEKRAREQRQNTEILWLEERRPLAAGQELDRRYGRKESERILQQHDDDADRRDY